MTPKVYDIVYSIGYDCTAARYMGKYFLRSYAGPFDWITLAIFPPAWNTSSTTLKTS